MKQSFINGLAGKNYTIFSFQGKKKKIILFSIWSYSKTQYYGPENNFRENNLKIKSLNSFQVCYLLTEHRKGSQSRYYNQCIQNTRTRFERTEGYAQLRGMRDRRLFFGNTKVLGAQSGGEPTLLVQQMGIHPQKLLQQKYETQLLNELSLLHYNQTTHVGLTVSLNGYGKRQSNLFIYLFYDPTTTQHSGGIYYFVICLDLERLPLAF